MSVEILSTASQVYDKPYF